MPHPIHSRSLCNRVSEFHGGGGGGGLVWWEWWEEEVYLYFDLGDLVDVGACGNRSMRIQD
jgi:hypothetical protein